MTRLFCFFIIFYFSIGCSHSIELDKYKNIRYGTSEANQLDVYVPDSHEGVLPVLIFVHGGSWCYSNRNMWWDSSKVEFFKQNGFISVVIDYRLSPYPYELTNEKRIKHPSHVQDVATSIKWVKSHIEKYGGDPNRIFLMGHSAGAHLVALVATNETFLGNEGLALQDIKGVCALDAGAYLTVDKKLLFIKDSSNVKQDYKDLKYAYMNAFGTDSTGYADANPYKHIEMGKHIPPFLLIYQNDSMRVKPNIEFIQKMNENKHKAKGVCVPSYGHVKIFSSIGSIDDPEGIGKLIIKFLKEQNY